MGDNKDNDFWNASNDDFWKEPVVSDDWLKSNSDTIWNSSESETTQNPYLKNDQTINKATQDNPYASTSWYETSYEQPIHQTSTQSYEEPVHQTSAQVYKEPVHQTSAQVYEQITGKAPAGEKKKQRHTIVCLCFIILAVISVVMSIFGASMVRGRAVKSLRDISYEEVNVDGAFYFYENNKVTIDNCAYTIVSEQSFTGFPKDQILIAVYVEVESEHYERDQYALSDPYIGYEYNGAVLHKKAAENKNVSPFISGAGFQSEHILYTYGCGNGWDNAGYYFFFVPADTERITLYAEQKTEENKVEVVEKIFKKELEVMPESEEITRELTRREAE